MRHRRISVPAMIVAGLLAAGTAAQAQSIWTRPAESGEGDFFTAANWSGGVPQATDWFNIDNGGTARFDIAPDQTHTVQIMNLGSGSSNRSGYLNQFSGTFKATGSVYLICATGYEAIYTLHGGLLQVSSLLLRGTGDSVFRHSGGNAAFGSVSIGSDIIFSGPQAGTYRLGEPVGGVTPNLTAGSVTVATLGLMEQTRGNANIDYYNLRGTHRFTGGTLTVNHGWRHAGLLDFEGAAVGVQAGNALVDLSRGGTIANGGSASFASGPLSMVIVPSGFNTGAFGGGWAPGNLVHTAGSPMNIAAGDEWRGWGEVHDRVNSAGTIDADGGSIGLRNGVSVSGGQVNLGTGSYVVNDLTSGVSGGHLLAGDGYIGSTAPGAFTHNGGTQTVGYLWLARNFDDGDTPASAGAYAISGTAVLNANIGMWLGYNGDATYRQSGGTVTTDVFTPGFGEGVTVNMEMTGGSLNTGAVRVADGKNSTATVTFSGGTWDCSGSSFMIVAGGRGSVATFNLSGDAVLDSERLSLAPEGIGTFNQSGGTHNIASYMTINGTANAEGRYNMSGGALNVDGFIGLSNVNLTEFNQTGGTVTADELRVGGASSEFTTVGNGTWRLGGTGAVVANQVNVGTRMTGEFIQTGGTSNVSGALSLGVALNYDSSRGTGTYELGGTGQLTTADTHVGVAGNGTFTQTGGRHAVAGDLVLGYEASGNGAYEISGGTLETAGLIVGRDNGADHGAGAFFVTDPAAQITVSRALQIGVRGELEAAAGVAIHMTGSNFSIASTDPTTVAGLSNLTLIFEGGPTPTDTFEVAGRDLGPATLGLMENFALHTLQVGGAQIGKLELVDLLDNQPGWTGTEALYVEHLILGSGSTLDVGSVNVYYGTFTDEGGTLLSAGGLVQPIPEPTAIGLLILGLGLCARRRHRVRTKGSDRGTGTRR